MDLEIGEQNVVLKPNGDVFLSLPESLSGEGNWLGVLFALAAQKLDCAGHAGMRYWQEWGERFVGALCHLPEETGDFSVPAPSEAERASFVLEAPPMRGGEYLSPEVLLKIWQDLERWARKEAEEEGGLAAFLQARAPKWSQVGRVCFHLAENKLDPRRPFAFMATYVAGLSQEARTRHQPLRRALKQYTGQQNRSALVRLLSPVHEASKRCSWVKELLESGRIYQPLALSPREAHTMLSSAETLEECGLAVRLPDWWKKRPRPRVQARIGDTGKATLGAGELLDFSVDVALGDERLTTEEWEALLDGEDGLVMVKGQWVEVDREKLRQALEHWRSLESEGAPGQIDFIKAMRLLSGASDDLRHEKEANGDQEWSHVEAGRALRKTLDRLRAPGDGATIKPPAALQAALRPYQKEGLCWLHLLAELGLGACLADDMGLGKTMQILALLLKAKESKKSGGGPSLLVAPASLLGNWKAEVEKFAPSLNLLFVHTSETERMMLEKMARKPKVHLKGVDLAVTTYATLCRQDWLVEQRWRYVILDEAQAIKTPTTRQTRMVKKLKGKSRIALTGTPVENQLGDLWSLFDFLNPGLLGSQKIFKSFVKDLEDRERDHYAPLRKLTAPYILRRLKTDKRIIQDLPEKTETTRFCRLSPKQARLYAKVVENLEASLRDLDGMKRRGAVLQTLMRLKQLCNHPSHFSGDGVFEARESGKFLRMAEICEELAQRQEKILVFTQFREIIAPLSRFLREIFQQEGLSLHGGTSVKKRQSMVDAFQRDNGPPFMILSLKAGGTGLNLTAASHVLHFDRWWNPAVENQATDRAFRIGQKRNVLVHKFVTQGTVEEKIDALIEGKKEMAEQVLSDEESVKWTELSNDEILDLVRLDLSRAKF